MKLLLLASVLCVLSACDAKIEPSRVEDLKLDQTTDPLNPDFSRNKDMLLRADKLEPFFSAAEFDAYVDVLRAHHRAENNVVDASGDGDMATMAAAPAAPESARGAAPGSITNNQEIGVDEGDIVKLVGDYLIVLRRGRLFSLRLVSEGEPSLTPVAAVNAFPEEHSTATWYDEMLVHDNQIIVIGFSYGYGATEIGLFSLSEDGAIAHKATHFLRSSDYYSSRNYASRMVENKVVFYMPFYFMNHYSEERSIVLPSQAQLLSSGQASEWKEIIDVATIIKPIEKTTDPVLHTIVMCDLSAEEFACDATGVVGPSSRSFYVSPTAVFLWTSDQGNASAYRLPLDGSSPTAIRARGVPVDQFSFKETDNGFLHVMLRDDGNGDEMWQPESRDGAVNLLSIPLERFSAIPLEMAMENYQLLPNVNGGNMVNRFVGDHVLYGASSLWEDTVTNKEVHIVSLSDKEVKTIALEHDVQRIETLGHSALVVGSNTPDLSVSVIDLADEPGLASNIVLENSAQGEGRSHGFFYNELSPGKGILGLPIRAERDPFGELFETSSTIGFMSITDNQIKKIGSFTSSTETDNSDDCIASCIDWYGNTRPIFLGDRILGLMGYDLIEGKMDGEAMNESARVNFMPRQTVLSDR